MLASPPFSFFNLACSLHPLFLTSTGSPSRHTMKIWSGNAHGIHPDSIETEGGTEMVIIKHALAAFTVTALGVALATGTYAASDAKKVEHAVGGAAHRVGEGFHK